MSERVIVQNALEWDEWHWNHLGHTGVSKYGPICLDYGIFLSLYCYDRMTCYCKPSREHTPWKHYYKQRRTV